jgi:hypothetical protein
MSEPSPAVAAAMLGSQTMKRLSSTASPASTCQAATGMTCRGWMVSMQRRADAKPAPRMRSISACFSGSVRLE